MRESTLSGVQAMTKLDKDAKTAMALIKAVYFTIVEAGEDGAPESALFMALAEKKFSMRVYQTIVDILVSQGLVKKKHSVLYAVKP